jgi:hypothetical protein
MDFLFIDNAKTTFEGFAETVFKEIQKLKEKKKKVNTDNEYKEISSWIESLFTEILLTKTTKKFLVIGTPKQREMIFQKYNVSISECIVIGNDELNIIIFNLLAGREGNILWLNDDVVELWSFEQLLVKFCK